MRTEPTYRSVVDACRAASCQIFSTTCSEDGWSAELEFDNLLHDGRGKTEVEALADALASVLNVTQSHHPTRHLRIV